MYALSTLWLSLLCSAAAEARPINPVPRPVFAKTLHEWTFDRDGEGWAAEHECTVSVDAGVLRIRSTGKDPYLHCGTDLPGGWLLLEMRARCETAGAAAVYWTTDRSANRGEDKVAHSSLDHDGQWHEFSVRFEAPGRLTDLRFDPGSAPGTLDVDWIRLSREEPHPLTIGRVQALDDRVRFAVKNHRDRPIEVSVDGQVSRIGGGEALLADRPVDGTRPLEAVSIEVETEGFPPVRRTVFLYHPEAKTDWIVRPSVRAPSRDGKENVSIHVAPDGSMALIRRNGTTVALVGPLVHCNGKLPAMERIDDGATLHFRGDGVTLSISIADREISVSIDSRRPCEGPVVRAIGPLEQGLLAGLEYLGRGERSSSKLDIETEGHLRFAPDPLMVTMPLMTFVTDRASVAMTWKDMQLQPVFATPNFFDAADDHRMALRGKQIEATIRIGGGPLTETILWAAKKNGLPPLPEPPRTPEQQWDLCLKALNGPLRTDDGWGHCVQNNWKRQPFADVASTFWRLTGEALDLPRLVPGGAHVPNESIYFVTGRAREWLDFKKRQVRGILDQQQPDGSFRYGGELARGHFEDTASGVCARPAATLLEYAHLTGDREALEAGVRTLEYMKRFRTPRGAQVWEVPLHTPDQLASAYLVWAYVRGYELTGKDEYLGLARKWAASGIPFVYLWDCYPIMRYSAPPVFGATQWRHSWFGLPVQWVGGVYAYALVMLAPHDDSLDWRHLARGILLSAEQQQYPDGLNVGLLPDSFNLRHQRRQPADINPCAVVSLRMVLDGRLDSLAVVTDGKHHVVAPFSVTIRDGKAHVQAKVGVVYQVIVDGNKIVDVKSQGEDLVPLP